MNEPPSIRRIDALQPFFASKITEWLKECKDEGIELGLTETLRTFERQRYLYRLGRTVPGNKVTNALPGQGLHNYGLAVDAYQLWEGKIDLNFDRRKGGMERQAKAAKIGNLYSLEWGGTWRGFIDTPHFEQWEVSWQTLLRLYPKGWIPGETKEKLWLKG